jgi:hypothetical protein
MSKGSKRHMMKVHDSSENLADLGFTPEQIEHLQQLHGNYHKKGQKERRRVEFVRWLVATGRLTDELPPTFLSK